MSVIGEILLLLLLLFFMLLLLLLLVVLLLLVLIPETYPSSLVKMRPVTADILLTLSFCAWVDGSGCVGGVQSNFHVKSNLCYVRLS